MTDLFSVSTACGSCDKYEACISCQNLWQHIGDANTTNLSVFNSIMCVGIYAPYAPINNENSFRIILGCSWTAPASVFLRVIWRSRSDVSYQLTLSVLFRRLFIYLSFEKGTDTAYMLLLQLKNDSNLSKREKTSSLSILTQSHTAVNCYSRN